MDGYAKIATLMGKHPESAQVLRFNDINLQNILYLQAEIFGLRCDLREWETKGQISDSKDVQNFALDWYTLAHTECEGKMNQQWQKVRELRALLKEYNTAVLQFHQMAGIAAPSRQNLRKLQEWLQRPTLGAVYLTGRDRNVWTDGSDLMCLGPSSGSEYLSAWVTGFLMPTYHRLIGKNVRAPRHSGSELGSNVVEYGDESVAKLVNFIGTVVASLLPIVAVVALYFIQNTGVRLGMISVFSAIFSASLWFLNDGKLIEVFAVTSAFAAVQVVFIGAH